MVFDPEKKIWIGNEKDLNVFNRPQPSLITNSMVPSLIERIKENKAN